MNSVGDSFNRFCTTRCPIKFSCTRWKSLFTPGLQQRQGFAGKPAGHIAGKLSGIIRNEAAVVPQCRGARSTALIFCASENGCGCQKTASPWVSTTQGDGTP